MRYFYACAHGHTSLDFVYILEKTTQMSNLQLTQEKL